MQKIISLALFATLRCHKLAQAGPPNPESGIIVKDGLITYDKAKFRKDFCPDVPAEKAMFIADKQVPWGIDGFVTEVTVAAVIEAAAMAQSK